MANIEQITVNNTTYNLKDSVSGYVTSSHSHGNITSTGDCTTNATIASGDRIMINDESASKIKNSSITFGTSTTTFLANDGTWQTPAGGDGTWNGVTNNKTVYSQFTMVSPVVPIIDLGLHGTGGDDAYYAEVSGFVSGDKLVTDRYLNSKITYGTADPSGGSNGDIYIKYES